MPGHILFGYSTEKILLSQKKKICIVTATWAVFCILTVLMDLFNNDTLHHRVPSVFSTKGYWVLLFLEQNLWEEELHTFCRIEPEAVVALLWMQEDQTFVS